MRRWAAHPAGLVLADKPAGPSSFALVRSLRDKTGAKAGHAGTLDPFASGLLLVLLGSATRLARYLVGLDKRYVADVDLTARTATGDPEGEVVEKTAPPSEEELTRRLAVLRGDVELRVPAASAVKIGGERAYRLARRGLVVDMPVRRSTVHALDLVTFDGAVARLEAHVGSGTYVRSLADALGGHCRTLRRTDVGPFHVDAADHDRILSPADAVGFLPAVEVSASDARLVRSGRAVAGPGEGPVRVMAGGALVAVGRAQGGVIRPETVLP